MQATVNRSKNYYNYSLPQ